MEVTGVILFTITVGGENADNFVIVKLITDASEVRLHDIKKFRLKWHYDGKELPKAERNGRKRGSVTISLSSEDIQ